MNNIRLAEETMGQRIKAQRIRMGYTQEQLAEKMFVPKTTISTYERDASDIKSQTVHTCTILFFTRNLQRLL